MTDAIEGKLTSWSAKANREVRLGFVIQADDHDKVLNLSKMVGHDFGIALAKIDQQPEKEKAEIVTASEPVSPARALSQRIGRHCADIRFRRWARDYNYVVSPDEELVSDWVRWICYDVKSRSEILPGTKEEQAWNLIQSAYEADKPLDACKPL